MEALVGCQVSPVARGLGGLTVTILLHRDPGGLGSGLSSTSVFLFLSAHTPGPGTPLDGTPI